MTLYIKHPGITRAIGTALLIIPVLALAHEKERPRQSKAQSPHSEIPSATDLYSESWYHTVTATLRRQLKVSESTPGPILLEIEDDNAAFAFSVSPAGDVNADGYTDVVIGANQLSTNYPTEGAAFVYLGGPTGLSTTPAWQIRGSQNGARMGHAVAGAGDLNGDGYADIAIGAPRYDVNGVTNTGIVYIFMGSAAGLSQTPSTQLSLNQPNNGFGTFIAGAGDVDNDGYNDLLIGTYNTENTAGNTTEIYLYHGSAAGIIATPKTRLQSNQPNSKFGESISTAGDINGDGYKDILIGAPAYTGTQTKEGAVFLYLGSSTGISSVPYQQFLSNQANASFGASVATAGDVNADGFSDILIGAPNHSNERSKGGAVWIYHGSKAGLQKNLVLESNIAGVMFGSTVAGAGDVNHDSFADILVGVPLYNSGATRNAGAAYLYLGGPAGSTSAPARIHEGTSGSESGSVVAGIGDANGDNYDDYLIGAYKAKSGKGGAVFHPGGTGPLPITLEWFTSHAQGCNAVLSWKAGIEQNLARYTIGMSTDGRHFTPIGEIPANNNAGTYTYTTPQTEPRIYYRLDITDIAGKHTYSTLTTVQTSCIAKTETTVSLYPNPANKHVNIGDLPATGTCQINFYDRHHRQVIQHTASDDTPRSLDVTALPPGLYTVQIIQSGEQSIKKLIIAH